MENLYDYSSFIELNEAESMGKDFTLGSLCDALRAKKLITAKTPANWPLIPQSKLKSGEKSYTGMVMVNGKPLNPAMPLKPTDKIAIKDGSIQFDNIADFGQAELIVKAGVPELNISTD